MLTQLKFGKGQTIEIYAIYPKRKLNPDDLEYYSAYFYRKLRLSIESENTQLIITKYDKPKKFTFYVARKWVNFVTKEPMQDWITHELMFTRESCQRVEIKFESEKEQRIPDDDIEGFLNRLEREGKIWAIFKSEDFSVQHV